MNSPDLRTFTSRLNYSGQLVFDSAHRIGAERTLDVTSPDLPILQTIDGLPYIPGSSLKGAWRAYTEAILRTIQGDKGNKLACNPIAAQSNDDERCLPQTSVNHVKKKYRGDQAKIDKKLRKKSCWTCRVFGNGHVASKVLIKDLMIKPETFYRTEIRDGVAIDRDSGRAASGMLYQFEAVPSGAVFDLDVVIENASPSELGVALLGLRALERGDILLGGAKSRGLGWCHVESMWNESEYVTADNLLVYALRAPNSSPSGVETQQVQEWLRAFEVAVQQEMED